MTEESKQSSDPWAHVIPLKETLKKRNAKAELAYLRDLFQDSLPAIESLRKANEYFDQLEELIEADVDIEREQLESDHPTQWHALQCPNALWCSANGKNPTYLNPNYPTHPPTTAPALSIPPPPPKPTSNFIPSQQNSANLRKR